MYPGNAYAKSVLGQTLIAEGDPEELSTRLQDYAPGDAARILHALPEERARQLLRRELDRAVLEIGLRLVDALPRVFSARPVAAGRAGRGGD